MCESVFMATGELWCTLLEDDDDDEEEDDEDSSGLSGRESVSSEMG